MRHATMSLTSIKSVFHKLSANFRCSPALSPTKKKKQKQKKNDSDNKSFHDVSTSPCVRAHNYERTHMPTNFVVHSYYTLIPTHEIDKWLYQKKNVQKRLVCRQLVATTIPC